MVSTNIENRTALITMQRPAKKNALNPELIEALTAAVKQANENNEVKTIVLAAEGEVFSAGADLQYLQSLLSNTHEQNLSDINRLADLYMAIWSSPKATIAKVQGHAIAGGCGLVTTCDFAFVADTAKLGYTEVKIGFVPALVSCFLIDKVGVTIAKEMLLTGKLITAADAKTLGIISHVVPGEELEATVTDFCFQLNNETSAQSIIYTKKLFTEINNGDMAQRLQKAAELNALARTTPDFAKGINSFLTKNKINW